MHALFISIRIKSRNLILLLDFKVAARHRRPMWWSLCLEGLLFGMFSSVECNYSIQNSDLYDHIQCGLERSLEVILSAFEKVLYKIYMYRCRDRHRCCERGLVPYGYYSPLPLVSPYYPGYGGPYYANTSLYQAYLNSNLYGGYYPGISPYYMGYGLGPYYSY